MTEAAHERTDTHPDNPGRSRPPKMGWPDWLDTLVNSPARPCADGECDEGRSCKRHRRAPEVIARAERLRARGVLTFERRIK